MSGLMETAIRILKESRTSTKSVPLIFCNIILRKY